MNINCLLEAFISIDELLRKMPRYNIGQTAADFEFRWRHWQTEVVARIDEGEFATCQQLAVFAKVLAGDDTTFKEEVQPKCETWYEWLIGKMLFTNPSVKIYDLPFHAEEAITNFGGLGSMTSLDSILLAGELNSIFYKRIHKNLLEAKICTKLSLVSAQIQGTISYKFLPPPNFYVVNVKIFRQKMTGPLSILF